MKRYSPFQKVMAMILSLVLIVGLVPTYAVADDGTAADSRVADPNTMNQWQDYFGEDKISTEFAGGVWTDKSVMTDADAFMAQITMDDPDNNFLIALSALAANQKVVGYASTPMDVMLVLDVSGSMDDDGKDEAMIEAANQAIESLLSQNNNNRVGVVLYSGNSSTNQNAGTNTATVILPLDHYTTTDTINIGTNQRPEMIPAYLTLSNNDNVSVPDGVRNSEGDPVDTGSKNVSGGTYIQNGLYKAWGEFSEVTDTVVPAGNAQAGAQRTPIMILMSDGQPTLATDNYNSVGTSESTYGNGSENTTTWQTVFLTQLTAAWVKGKMEAHYNTTPKFYTLGLGTGNSNYATAVLNPSNSYNTLNSYWNRFFNNSVNNSGNVNVGSNNDAWRIYKDSNVKAQDYVDQYWLAENTDDLLAAFESIVDTIELDAAEHVTLVEDIGEDMSGYITFTDELGVFMEVKDVKGLVLGDNLFAGYELAKSLQESSMGTQQNPTDLGNEFISTVRERLGIDNVTDAQSLVIAAYADGQLAYNAQTGEYSNYIGWYSNDAGDYLGFWDKDTGITAEGAPTGATWINKSYGYLGIAGDSDMMHVIVMISTHIESGMQVVQYKIPASLIPTVTYEIELEGSDPTKMKSIKRNEAFPLRLVYEVGLQDGINSVNVAQKLQEAIDAGWGHAHIEEDGSYAFYTNLWGAEEGDEAIDYNDPLNHQVAQSHFHPAVGNDRYYYTEDTPVYSDTNGTLYTGSAAPAGDGFYRAHHYYTEDGYTTEYLPMSEYALQMAAANGQAEDGGWYIPEGAIFQQIDRFHLAKSENATGTLEYYDYPVVVDIGDKYDVYAFLGNNGKLTITPAQGIRLTKTVSEAVEGADDSFTFDITLSQAVENPLVTDADGNALTGWSVNGNVITVTLKAGETVCVTGLPTGVTYTVTERAHADYIGSSENATGTVEANKVNAVDFVNIPKGYGNLIISKDVDHPYTNVPEALTNKEFTINVTLSGEDVANKQFAIAGTDPVEYVTTDANGSFSVTLKDNGSLTVAGLPEGTTFTTTETLDPTEHKGFTMDADRSTLAGTIVKDTAVQTHVVNVYAPSSPVASIDVAGTKTLTDEAGTFDWTGKSFTIRLEQYDAATGTYTLIDETTVTEGSLDYKFEDKLTFNAIGTYYYKVSEVIPEDRLEGMSYDATVGRFEVQVTDNDVDGELEFVVYDFDTREQITGTDLNYTYTKDFENIHTTDATYVEFTVDKNVVDPHNTGASEAGYLFELYEVVDGVTSTTAAYSMRTVLVNGEGQATFHIPITKTGTRTFILKESEPLDAERIPGMSYDDREYTVIVSATAQDGKLVPSVSFELNGDVVGQESLYFQNVIDLDPLTLKPYVTKTLIGREPLSDSEFTFNIVQTDGSFATAIEGGYSDTTSVGEGDKYFKEITVTTVGTYYFRTTEVIGNAGGMTYDNSIYHVTVDVTAEDGKLVKNVTYVKVGQGVPSTETDFVQFTNTYVNNDTAEVTLEGSKTLTGRSLITGEFSFQLKEGETVLQTVTNRADGSFVFAPITYTAADVGNHTYTIVEVNDGKGGIDYDTKTYTVTVKVEDNGQGQLVVTTTGADDIEFNNKYSTEPTSVSFGGTKTWYNTDLGQDKPMTGGEFTFLLYASDESYSTQGAEVARTSNSASGAFGFEISYDTPGHYYYLLREVIGEDAATGYDTGIYRIHIAVYDNGLGQLVGSVAEIYKVGTGASTITFGNRYTPAPTQIVIEGEKELTNHQIADGEFGFQLFAADAQFTASGDALQTVYNTGNGFAFEAIEYEKSGTYYYVVKEVIPELAENNVYNGITYDTTAFGVTVTVTDQDGQLSATYAVTVDGTAKDLEFVNEYHVPEYVETEISGKKLLNGTSDLGGRTFEFVLLDENEVQLQKVTCDQDGSFTFKNIVLTGEAGQEIEHTFYIREVDNGLGGITYDGRTYTFTVEVYDDGEGNLHKSTNLITLDGETVTDVVFENTYTLEETSAQFRAQKLLENKDLTADMFQFELVDSQNNVIQTKGNLLGGGIVFDAIEYTEPGDHTYTIREVVPEGGVKDGITYDGHEITVKVSVTDNGDGTMTADVTYEGLRRFTNTYNVTGDPEFDLSGTKELTGRDIQDGEFTFVLTDSEGKEIEVTNIGKTFSFNNVKLPGLGTHTFTVTEKNTGKGGVAYDSREYKVSVTVSDDGKGGMTVGAPIVTYNGVAAQLTFKNTYTVTGEPKFDLSGTKTLTGIREIEDGEFTFVLTDAQGNEIETTNVGNTFSFTDVELPGLGTHKFTVTEKNTGKGGVSYDGKTYSVSVTVDHDGEGNMVVGTPVITLNQTSAQLVFTNGYTVTGDPKFDLSGTKTLTGIREIEDGEFTFVLTDAQGNEIETTNVGNTFSFTDVELPGIGTFVYTLTEKNTGKGGVTYDTAEYQVSVTVEDNKVGGMTVGTPVVTLDGQPASPSFNNSYSVDDEESVEIEGTKKLTGDSESLTDHVFKFRLLDSTGAEVETVSNNADGSFAFKPLEFTEEHISETPYLYTVVEVNEGKGGITYDTTVYTVKVTVEDNGLGGITVTKYIDDDTAGRILFENTYTVTGTEDLKLTAKKKLDGRTLEEGEFSFQLKDETGKVLQTKTNDKDGNITFDAITYGKEHIGKYIYTVSEVNDEKGGVDYDPASYLVVVTVADNNNGGISVTKTVNGGNTDIVFNNSYAADDEKTVTLAGVKKLTGDSESLTDHVFKFRLLDSTGAEVETVSNNADGSFAFKTLEFTEEHISETPYLYTVVEVNEGKGGITYDTTVYTVKITVEDNLLGGITVTKYVDNDTEKQMLFENTYTVTGEPVFSVSGTKELTGRDLVDGEFTFVLTDSEGKEIEVTNIGKTFSFDNVKLPGLGTHSFTVTEKNTGVGTITYDAAEYTVTVTVVDNNEGGMTVEAPVITLGDVAAELVFSNVYTEPDPITVDVNITKTVEGKLSPKGFQFELIHDGKVATTVQTDENGKAVLPITFHVDAVGSHEFLLREVNTGVKHVTYDAAQYQLKVTITETEDGQLAAQVQLDGNAVEEVNVEFVNKYDPPATPETGDSSNPALLMGTMSFSALGIIILLAVLVLDRKKGKFER